MKRNRVTDKIMRISRGTRVASREAIGRLVKL
jgi:hypothetical protein